MLKKALRTSLSVILMLALLVNIQIPMIQAYSGKPAAETAEIELSAEN